MALDPSAIGNIDPLTMMLMTGANPPPLAEGGGNVPQQPIQMAQNMAGNTRTGPSGLRPPSLMTGPSGGGGGGNSSQAVNPQAFNPDLAAMGAVPPQPYGRHALGLFGPSDRELYDTATKAQQKQMEQSQEAMGIYSNIYSGNLAKGMSPRDASLVALAHPDLVSHPGTHYVLGRLSEINAAVQSNLKSKGEEDVVNTAGHVDKITEGGQTYLMVHGPGQSGVVDKIKLTNDQAEALKERSLAGEASAHGGLYQAQTQEVGQGIEYTKSLNRALGGGGEQPQAAPGTSEIPVHPDKHIASSYPEGANHDFTQDDLGRASVVAGKMRGIGIPPPGFKGMKQPINDVDQKAIGNDLATAQALRGIFEAAADPSISTGPIRGAITTLVNRWKQTGEIDANMMAQMFGGHVAISAIQSFGNSRAGAMFMRQLQQIIPQMSSGPLAIRAAAQQSMRLLRDDTGTVANRVVTSNPASAGMFAGDLDEIDKSSRYVLGNDASLPVGGNAAPGPADKPQHFHYDIEGNKKK